MVITVNIIKRIIIKFSIIHRLMMNESKIGKHQIMISTYCDPSQVCARAKTIGVWVNVGGSRTAAVGSTLDIIFYAIIRFSGEIMQRPSLFFWSTGQVLTFVTPGVSGPTSGSLCGPCVGPIINFINQYHSFFICIGPTNLRDKLITLIPPYFLLILEKLYKFCLL